MNMFNKFTNARSAGTVVRVARCFSSDAEKKATTEAAQKAKAAAKVANAELDAAVAVLMDQHCNDKNVTNAAEKADHRKKKADNKLVYQQKLKDKLMRKEAVVNPEVEVVVTNKPEVEVVVTNKPEVEPEVVVTNKPEVEPEVVVSDPEMPVVTDSDKAEIEDGGEGNN